MPNYVLSIILALFLVLILFRPHIINDWVRYSGIHRIQSHELRLIKYYQKPRVPTTCRTVITMTTIPSRINSFYYSLYSVLDQTHRVDEIIINIPYTSRKNVPYVIPSWLTRLARANKTITIHRCESDVGPITKLLPTLERYRHEHVHMIVVDDDVIYKKRHIHNLCKLSLAYPNHAITGTGYRALNKDRTSRIYRSFGHGVKQVDVLMGVSGFLVNTTMFDYDRFVEGRNKCPEYVFVDDNYISLHLMSRNIPIISMKYGNGLSCPEFANFMKMIFNLNSDSLCRTMNKPSSNGWFGENESKIMSDHGMYLTQSDYVKFYFL